MKPLYISRGVIVGFFVLTSVLIFSTSVFIIGNQQKTFEKTAVLKAVFDDVNGLQQGNNVWLSGVKIGTVKKLRFLENTDVEVTMNIEKQAQSHIRKDAFAKISTDGFIGNRIIIIYGGTVSAPLVSGNDYLKTQKSISTDDMLATLRQSNNNVAEVTKDLRDIISKIKNGKGTLGELVNNSAAAENILSGSVHLKAATINAEKAIAKADDYLSQLNNKGTMINELITDTTVFSDLKETIRQFKNSSERISGFSDDLQRAGTALHKTDNIAGAVLNDEQLASDLKSISKNLNESSEKLDEDLKALQHSFLLKGYFKKQEKNKTKQDTQSKAEEK